MSSINFQRIMWSAKKVDSTLAEANFRVPARALRLALSLSIVAGSVLPFGATAQRAFANDAGTAIAVSPGSLQDTTWFGPVSSEQLDQLSAEIVAETNTLRADPAAYAQRLIALRPYYEGNLVKVPGHPIVEVFEGVSALDEAIAVLQNTSPLPQLSASAGMALGAADHSSDLGTKNATGHYGSDGSDPFTRINRYGEWQNTAGENISYGAPTIAEWHVIQLLIDDGVANRGHREVLLREDYGATGAACETHAAYRIVCVMTYAGAYQEAN